MNRRRWLSCFLAPLLAGAAIATQMRDPADSASPPDEVRLRPSPDGRHIEVWRGETLTSELEPRDGEEYELVRRVWELAQP